MRQVWIVAAAMAVVLASCGQGADGPPLPPVKAGATPPSTQSPASPTQQATVDDATRQSLEGAVLVAPLSQWAEGLWRLSKNRLLAAPAKAGGAL